MSVRHTAILEAAGIGHGAQAMAGELIDHRLAALLGLLALDQRLNRRHPRAGTRPRLRSCGFRIAGSSRHQMRPR